MTSLTIGCDPEFTLYDRKTDETLYAGYFRSRHWVYNEGRDRLSGLEDKRWEKFEKLEWGREVGDDASLVELRPHPQPGAKEMVKEIHRLLTKFALIFPDRDVIGRAGASSGRMLQPQNGGHVHLSWEREVGFYGGSGYGGSGWGVDHYSYNPVVNQALHYLDLMVGLPVALICKPEEFYSRSVKYGRLSEHRVQKHGLEYRTLPSWLVSPTWALRILTLISLVHKEIAGLPEGMRIEGVEENWKELKESWGPDYVSGSCGCHWGRGCDHGYVRLADFSLDPTVKRKGKMKVFESFTAPMWGEIMERDWRMQLFLKPWISLIRRGGTWDSESDLFTNWRVPQFLPDPKMMLAREMNERIKDAVRRGFEQVGEVKGGKALYVTQHPFGLGKWLLSHMEKEDLVLPPVVGEDEASRVVERALKGDSSNV